MRLVFMGTPDFAVPSLRAILRDGHDVAAVVTRPDRPRRSQSSRRAPAPVKSAASTHGLPVLQPASVKETAFIERLKALAPESIIVVAFGQILPTAVLEVPERWCINLHASLLPNYRGAAPIARAILAEERVTGVTTMKIDRGLDTGDILEQETCAISPAETAGELTGRLAEIGAGLLVKTLRLHARAALRPRPQDHAAATSAPPLTKNEGRIGWSSGAPEIAALIRGCNPWPVAVAQLAGRPVQILRAVSHEALSGDTHPEPGKVIAASGDRILVECAGGSVLAILEMRFPGRRAITAQEALTGRLICLGDLFASPVE